MEVVKEEQTDKYTEEPIEDEKKVYAVTPVFATSKVEGYVGTTEGRYGSTCDDVSIYSVSSLQSFDFIEVILVSPLLQPLIIGCENILLRSKDGHP